MAKQVTGTKTVPVDADTLIIKDSEAADVLKEISVGDLTVAAAVETANVSGLRTITLYSDVGQTNPIGTFQVQDGASGTGVAIPPYSNVATYAINDAVEFGGDIYRSLVASNSGNQPDTSSTQWQRLSSTNGPLITMFTSSGTFTPHPLAVKVKVEIQGGGGGGAGTAAIGANSVACGTGGNSGAYGIGILSVVPTSNVTITIGSGGSGGVGVVGTNGANSSFGSNLIAEGGIGGRTTGGGGVHVILASSASTGEIVTYSGAAEILSITSSQGGSGWSSRIGTADPSHVGGFANGANAPFGNGGLEEGAVGGLGGQLSIVQPATGFGSGGSGIASNSSTSATAKTGGSGRGGFVKITEYFA